MARVLVLADEASLRVEGVAAADTGRRGTGARVDAALRRRGSIWKNIQVKKHNIKIMKIVNNERY